ncbi:MAG TPA: tail fiber protein [Pseudolabrys sp.]|jgi:microcystin-dependent protein
MTEPFLGQIQLYGFNFAPKGWAFCAGQVLPISQNAALFSLLGVNYGGDGVRTFGLPNLQQRVAVGFGSGTGLSTYQIGESGGTTAVTIDSTQMAAHTHSLVATTDRGSVQSATNNLLGTGASGPPTKQNAANLYSGQVPNAVMPASIGPTGGGQPHANVQPSLTLNYCIALAGTFPQRQ